MRVGQLVFVVRTMKCVNDLQTSVYVDTCQVVNADSAAVCLHRKGGWGQCPLEFVLPAEAHESEDEARRRCEELADQIRAGGGAAVVAGISGRT